MIFLRHQMAVHTTAKRCLCLVDSHTDCALTSRVVGWSGNPTLGHQNFEQPSSAPQQLMDSAECYIVLCMCALLIDSAAAYGQASVT